MNLTNIPLIIIFCLLAWVSNIQTVSAQELKAPCGNATPGEVWENDFQQFIKKYRNSGAKELLAGTYIIPVIFHILHSGQSVGTFPNLSSGQILSQIDVLNQDFSGKATFISKYPADAFKQWAINQSLPPANLDAKGRVKIADFNIEFCAAIQDEQGKSLPEPGIERVNLTSKSLTNPNTFTDIYRLIGYVDSFIKPATIWDPAKYLNIWVSDKISAILFAGYASMPPLSSLPGTSAIGTYTTDGIWCSASALGSYLIYPAGTYVSSAVIGQVATHEVGHWLGLRHIWGDAPCGSDYCNDTPPALDANTASPSYPLNAGSCSSPSNAPNGEMFMNFMDYTYGDGKYMFTTDQATRARTAMTYSPLRKLLGSHGICAPTGIKNYATNDGEISIVPNPANDWVTIGLHGQKLRSVSVLNTSGKECMSVDTIDFSIKNLTAGLYFVVIKTEENMVYRKIVKQ